MATKVMKDDASIAVEGFVQMLAIWDKMDDSEVEVRFSQAQPVVNFHKINRDVEGRACHAVLKLNKFNNNLTFCFKSVKPENELEAAKGAKPKYFYTKDSVISTGMHVNNCGLDKDGNILHILDEDKQEKPKVEKPF